MAIQVLKERNTGNVGTVTIGATKEQGGTRTSMVTIGGSSCLPFLHFEGEMPSKPVIAMEVFDRDPIEWNENLRSALGAVTSSTVAWAKKCVDNFGAEMILLRLQSADPDFGAKSVDECIATVKDVLGAVGVPVGVIGCGIDEIDNKLIASVAEACAGENLLLGTASQDNYNTIVAACMVHKHVVIANSPLDINICKQLNILITDMGLGADKIVIDPSIGGLGYGIEYAYSIQERSRLGALQGDKMLSMPILGMIGQESWKAKEANISEEESPGWGNSEIRGILWEALTATSLLQAGMDLLVMRHPESVKIVRRNIDMLMKSNAV